VYGCVWFADRNGICVQKIWKLVEGPYHICKREPYDMYRRCTPHVKETCTNVKEAQMIGGRHIHPESGHL